MLPAGGAARARRTLALTDEGTRAATGLSAALEPVALQGLDGEARALLGAIARGEAKRRSASRRRGAARARRARASSPSTRRCRRAARAPRRSCAWRAPLDGEARAAAFGRAKKRGELYERIAAAGTIALSALRQADARAGEHVRALVEAGLVTAETRELARRSVRRRAHRARRPAAADAGAGGGAGDDRAEAARARATRRSCCTA